MKSPDEIAAGMSDVSNDVLATVIRQARADGYFERYDNPDAAPRWRGQGAWLPRRNRAWHLRENPMNRYAIPEWCWLVLIVAMGLCGIFMEVNP